MYKMYNDTMATEMNENMRAAVLPVTVFVGIEAFVGFVGNSVVLYVFMFKYHVCNFRYFVICLALVDIISTLTTMPGEVFTQLHWYVFPSEVVCKVKSFFNMFTVIAEAMCLFFIAIDRFRKICQPFRKQITPTMARLICFFSVIGACVVSVPVPLLWGINTHTKYYNVIEQYVNVTVCELDQRVQSKNCHFTYVTTMLSFIAACLLGMIVLYVLVVKQLVSRHALPRREYVPPQESHRNTETILLQPKECTSINEYTVVNAADDLPPSIKRANLIGQYAKNDHNDDSIDGKDVPELKLSSDVSTNSQMSTLLHNANTPAKDGHHRMNKTSRIRRKTLIMFILTILFVCTTVTYLTLLTFITKGVLLELSDTKKAIYFFFFRLVFINQLINPFVYWWLDTKFRNGLKAFQTNMFK